MKPFKILPFCLLLFLSSPFSFAQTPGDLDLTLNWTGFRVDSSALSENATDVVVMNDGRIVVAGIRDDGNMQGFLVRRYLGNGLPDSSLGTSGMIQTTENDIYFGSTDVAVQVDGKILLIGTESDFNKIVVQRLLVNGQTDTSFANGGRLQLGYPTGNSSSGQIFVLPNGKIQFTLLLDGSFQAPTLSMIQLLPDGTVDPFFANNGTGSMNFPDFVMRLNSTTRMSDGSLAVTGVVDLSSDQVVFVAKFDALGIPDASFGNGGYMYLPPNSFDIDAWAIASNLAGDLYLTGYNFNSPNNLEISVRKISANGQVDSNYGQGGELLIGGTGADYHGSALEVDAAGRLILGGMIANPDERVMIARILPQGQLDPTFGSGGMVAYDLGQPISEARGIAIQPNGHLLVTGYAIPDGFSPSTFLARHWMGPATTVVDRVSDPFFSIYPNPCESHCILKLELPKATSLCYSLKDVLGKPVFGMDAKLNLPSGKHEIPIDLSSLVAGLISCAS
jgi:uncharacterized delta-60 repeat protein